MNYFLGVQKDKGFDYLSGDVFDEVDFVATVMWKGLQVVLQTFTRHVF